MLRLREEIINTWFDMWMGDDISPMEALFTKDVVYCECQGREYVGIAEIGRWFVEWHQNNSVKKWEANRFLHEKDKTVVEWCFEGLDESGKARVFDGLYLVEWDGEKIAFLKEYGAKVPLVRPYL